MYEDEDRHALLFESSRLPDLSCPKNAATMCKSASKDRCLFPERSPATVPTNPESSAVGERVAETGETLVHHDLAQPRCPQRRVTLFASIEVAPTQRGLAEQAVHSYPFLSYDQAHQPPQFHQPQRTSALPSLSCTRPPNSGIPHTASSTAHERSATCKGDASQCFSQQQDHGPLGRQHDDGAPLRLPHSCSPSCSYGAAKKGGNPASNLVNVETHLAYSGQSDMDTRRFVVQELQEINRMIQARALRLKQQEEEAAAYAATVRNSLRLHAQQLLNQAAEKLERVAAQHRKRAEAAADEAATILRKALEAQRLLRHERGLLKQLQEQRHEEEHLRLAASSEALAAERRLCRDLEGQLQAVKQENRQLRALLHAHPPLTHRGDKKTQMSSVESSSVFHERLQAAGRRSTAACHTSRLCGSQIPSAAAGFVPPVSQRGMVTSSEPGKGVQRGRSLRAGNVQVFSSCMKKAAPERAVVDVQVRLPSFRSAMAAVPVPETHVDPAGSGSPAECAEGQQPLRHVQQDPPHSGCPVPEGKTKKLTSSQISATRQRRKHRSTDGSARRTDDSPTSSASRSSSNSHVEQADSQTLRGRVGGRLSRSASRGSVSTSTSSSSAAPKRRSGRHRGRAMSSGKSPSARSQRISFSVPELTHRKPRKGNLFFGSPSPGRIVTGGHRLALRDDVAGRLQASLTRLQEQQQLQGKIHSLAKHLLNMQGRADLP